jgi:hypothetical protein
MATDRIESTSLEREEIEVDCIWTQTMSKSGGDVMVSLEPEISTETKEMEILNHIQLLHPAISATSLHR